MQPREAKGGKCENDKCRCKNPQSKFKDNCCSYTKKYIFFDYEAQQETGIHVPNLIIAEYYSGETFTFKTNDEFCNWLVSKQDKGYTAIALHAHGYDSHFILQYCINNTV